MKKNTIFAFSLGAISLGLLSFNQSIYNSAELSYYKQTHAKNASGAPAGRTGAPGEQSCVACHSGSALNGDDVNSLVMLDGNNNPVTSYFPDSTYTMVFNNTDPAVKKGFQLVGLKVSDNLQAGNLTGNSSTGTNRITSGNKQYINHTGASTGFTNGWRYTWTAPSTNVGDVRFYVAANATNNNNNTSGDKIYLSQHTFSADATASILESQHESKTSVFYNSQKHELVITIQSNQHGTGYVNLIDASGKVVTTKVIGSINKGANDFSIDLSQSLTNGIYFAHIFIDNQSFKQKINIAR
jgi:hypothetical protein